MERLPTETIDEYRERRKKENSADKAHLNGKIVTEKHSGFSREVHREILNTAKKELKKARSMGFSDVGILEALRTGNQAQKQYADYIEYFIMKAG